MQADFVIIGGGIAGLSVAARLAPHGKVVLCEGEDNFGHHASGRSAALYEPRYGAPPVVGLSLASGDYFHETPGLLSPRGLMVVGRADQAAEFASEIAEFDMAPCGVDAARARVPILNADVVAHAAMADHAWDIDTDLMLQGFARAARAHGADLRVKSPVTAIARGAKGWSVATGTGPVEATVLVNAAGAWVDRVAAMAGIKSPGFQPYRRSMARLPAPGGHDVSRWPMMFGVGEAWYAKPDAGALIVSPAEEHPMDPHDAWADDMVLAEGLARYEAMVTEPVTRILSNWAGLRTFSPDRALVIGPAAQDASFIWLAGQGGYGFQSAPAASQLAADLILGHPSALDAPLRASLSPARFGL